MAGAGVYLPERCSIVELRDDATLEVPVPDTSQPYESRKDRGAKYKEVRWCLPVISRVRWV